ncbi:DUF111 family protein [Candidatus Collierbacteria bacterium]|nr:DUF111 family protein [Candidatus Collierbacteria bacterium]
MKIGYFDCIGGASGDMILGSLIDVGLPIAVLKRELEKLPIQGWTLNAKNPSKSGKI